MRTKKAMATLGGAAALVLALGVCPARAEDAPAAPEAPAAPVDPTRGQWDSFLDPFRDFEDNAITGTQKSIEDASKVHIGVGAVEAYQWNFNRPGNGLNSFHSLDPDHNSGAPAFGQLWANRPSEGWVPGFGVSLDWGRGAKRSKSDWDGDGIVGDHDTFENNDFDVKEAYLQYTLADTGTPLDGLGLKAGKFVTTAGAEVIEPWLNYNYSRSFLFGLAIPFTHTGVLVSYPVTEKLNLTGGVVEGWDDVKDNNNSPSILTSATWTITDQVSLAGTGIWGPEQTHKISNKRELGDLVLTVKPTAELTLLLNYDYGHEDAAALDGGPEKWQGFAVVGNYAFTDRFSLALRGEWFEDHGGARTGLSQTLYEGTATAKYLITQHLYGQVEFRRDEGSKDTFAKNETDLAKGQTIFGFAVGWVFN